MDINGVEVSDDSDDPTILDNVDNNGDGDPDDPTETVLPIVLGANFEIFNGVTPDGDGLNDYFIRLSDRITRSKGRIVNLSRL